MHARVARRHVLLAFTFFVFVWFAAPEQGNAHVKWFCGVIDLRAPPRALAAVLSPMFLARGSVFLLLIIIGSALDSLISRRWPILENGSSRLEFLEEMVVRLCLAGYMLGVSTGVAVVPWSPVGDGAILTPDLYSSNHFASVVQILIALSLVLRRTCFLAGLGLAALYTFGIVRYGVFHMTDYVFFLGLAAYLILSFPRFDREPTLRSWRVPILVGSLAFSLMWTAIEKFLYPGWTEIVVAIHPSIGMGFPAPFVTLTAGFVEFTLAFYLLVGHSLLRPGAMLFMLIFIVAIPEFGVLDGVGHLPIIAIFLVTIMHGVSRLQLSVRPQGTRAWRSAASVAGLYMGTFATEMALYYGLQKTAGW